MNRIADLEKRLDLQATALERLKEQRAASVNTQQATLKTNRRARDHNGNKKEESIFSTGSLTVNEVLMWPCIRKLLNRSHDVLALEEQQVAETSSRIGDPSVPALSLPNDDAGANETWPGVRGMSSMDGYSTSTEMDPEIDRSGRLQLDATTARRYFQSYLDQVHNLHPFLWHDELVLTVNGFIDKHCLSTSIVSSLPFIMPRDRGHGRPPGDPQATHVSVGPDSALFPIHVEQNINNAVTLLVLALGAIAKHGTLHANSDRAHETVAFPGLTLYEHATAILGLYLGGASIRHAQAAMLATLYADQIIRPLQTHSWMYQASRACKALAQPESYKRLADDRAKGIISAAFCACIELENGLTELDFSACGISNGELCVSAPGQSFSVNFAGDEEARGSRMTLFQFAIELNIIITCANTTYMEMDKHRRRAEQYLGFQRDLSVQLQRTRSKLPDSISWKDSDPPATNVEAARVRATYYWARFLIHKPALFVALHDSQARPSTGGSRRSSCELPDKIGYACKICVESAILYTYAFESVPNSIIVNTFGVADA